MNDQMSHAEAMGKIADMAEDIESMRGLILRASAELETVEYENDPPAHVAQLLDEMRAVNRAALLAPNNN